MYIPIPGIPASGLAVAMNVTVTVKFLTASPDPPPLLHKPPSTVYLREFFPKPKTHTPHKLFAFRNSTSILLSIAIPTHRHHV